jgi:hypothetical protein
VSIHVTLEILRDDEAHPLALEVRNSEGLYLHLVARHRDTPLNEAQMRSLGETIVRGAREVGASVEWVEELAS